MKILKMENFTEKLVKPILSWFWAKSMCVYNSFRGLFLFLFHILLFRVSPFWIHFSYLFLLSSFGFFALTASSDHKTNRIRNFDLFFTSVSSVTSSSMSTVEMERFSNTQLLFLTIMIFCSGEVFLSVLGLHWRRYKLKHKIKMRILENRVDLSHMTISISNSKINLPNNAKNADGDNRDQVLELVVVPVSSIDPKQSIDAAYNHYYNLKSNSLRALSNIVSCYLVLVQAMGSILISVYLNVVPNTKQVLKQKNLNVHTFTVFASASTFANCGFLPTNENIMPFVKNSGLLLILIPQVLMGNTFFPVFLRLILRLMEKMSNRDEFGYLLKNSSKFGYGHLFPGLHSLFIGITAVGIILVQFVVFSVLEWESEAGFGLSAFEKLIACLFQVVNVRHTGEAVFDIAAVSPPMLIIFLVMMYLPSYTSYLPIEMQAASTDGSGGKHKNRTRGFWDHIILSQLSYLLIFITIICITEREKMKKDPINFSVFNIIFEVISAYGNVGFSMGYSCEKRIDKEGSCENAWTGFAGRWSNEGKFLLIIVMFFGKLKKFNLRGGKAWVLS